MSKDETDKNTIQHEEWIIHIEEKEREKEMESTNEMSRRIENKK